MGFFFLNEPSLRCFGLYIFRGPFFIFIFETFKFVF